MWRCLSNYFIFQAKESICYQESQVRMPPSPESTGAAAGGAGLRATGHEPNPKFKLLDVVHEATRFVPLFVASSFAGGKHVAPGKTGGLGQRVTMHTLRHSLATQMLEIGSDFWTVRDLHASHADTGIGHQKSVRPGRLRINGFARRS